MSALGFDNAPASGPLASAGSLQQRGFERRFPVWVNVARHGAVGGCDAAAAVHGAVM